MPSPLRRISGVHSGAEPSPNGATARHATTMARARPSSCEKAAPVRFDRMMYAAQQAPARAASPSPMRSSSAKGTLRASGDEDDAGGGTQHREEVQGPTGQDDGEHERAEELDGHGDPDREAAERGVERRVHGPEGQTEEHHGEPRVAGCPRTWARDGQEDHGVDEEAPRHRAGRAGEGDQGRRQRSPELDGDDAEDDEDGSRDPAEEAWSRRRWHTVIQRHGHPAGGEARAAAGQEVARVI